MTKCRQGFRCVMGCLWIAATLCSWVLIVGWLVGAKGWSAPQDSGGGAGVWDFIACNNVLGALLLSIWIIDQRMSNSNTNYGGGFSSWSFGVPLVIGGVVVNLALMLWGTVLLTMPTSSDHSNGLLSYISLCLFTLVHWGVCGMWMLWVVFELWRMAVTSKQTEMTVDDRSQLL